VSHSSAFARLSDPVTGAIIRASGYETKAATGRSWQDAQASRC
jgi:hypothetical protein